MTRRLKFTYNGGVSARPEEARSGSEPARPPVVSRRNMHFAYRAEPEVEPPHPDIDGLIYFVQTDNAVDDGTGKALSIADLSDEIEFTNGTAAHRFALNTAIAPGHTVLQKGWAAGSQPYYLMRTDAPMLAPIAGDTSVTYWMFIHPVTTSAFSPQTGTHDDGAAQNSMICMQNVGSPTMRYIRKASGALTEYDVSWPQAAGTWQLQSYTYDATTGVVSAYENGVLKGTAAGTRRSLPALSRAFLNGPNPSSNLQQAYYGGWGLAASALDAAKHLEIDTWYRESFELP